MFQHLGESLGNTLTGIFTNYKPHAVVPLSLAHKTARKTFCEWLLEQPEGFERNVIWSDEKWFMLRQSPNKQNERYWYPLDPEIERESHV